MKKLILIMISLFFFTNSIFAELPSKEILQYFRLIENIMNNEDENHFVTNNVIIIEKEWYSNRNTKSQWYGELLHMYLFDNGKIKKCNDDTIKVFLVADRFNSSSFLKATNENIIYIVFFQRKDNNIQIMFRNDIWYYSLAAKISTDENGRKTIIDIPDYIVQND